MTRSVNRQKGVVTTYTTFGELIAAVIEGSPNRKVALELLGPYSPLSRHLKQQIVLVP